MRGWLKHDFPNSVSMLALYLNEQSGKEQIKAEISDQLSKGVHWGFWYLLQLGSYLNLQTLIRDSWDREQWSGYFTDLGEYQVNSNSSWVFANQGNFTTAVSAAKLMVNSETTISLRLHPYFFSNGLQRAQQILLQIKDRFSRQPGH